MSRDRTPSRLAAAGLSVLVATVTLAGASRRADPVDLVWHVETPEGKVLDSRRADAPVNPASVMKLATTLWALELLGPEFRFETSFAATGSLDRSSGRLDGDLVVLGSGDPDFHVENAYLVARALNAAGVREVRGSLVVSPEFWIGWEGGSARREPDPARRIHEMGRRLRDALDPARRKPATRRALDELAVRRGLAEGSPAGVRIVSGVSDHGEAGEQRTLVIHRSNPLVATLKRFNAFSNNDIERFEAHLGTAREMQAMLAERLPGPGEAIRVGSHSGLGTNRMTPRQIVALLRELDRASESHGLRIEDLLPVAGCDPGTLKHFPGLRGDELTGSIVAKTGTLTTTDGGVAVLAGVAQTRHGRRLFVVAAPGMGKKLQAARRAQERWLLGLIAEGGGPRSRECPPPVVHSDLEATVLAPTRGAGNEAACAAGMPLGR